MALIPQIQCVRKRKVSFKKLLNGCSGWVLAPDKSFGDDVSAFWVLIPYIRKFSFSWRLDTLPYSTMTASPSSDDLVHHIGYRLSLSSSLRCAHCTHHRCVYNLTLSDTCGSRVASAPCSVWGVSTHIAMMKNPLLIKPSNDNNYHKMRGGVFENFRILEIQLRVACLACLFMQITLIKLGKGC